MLHIRFPHTLLLWLGILWLGVLLAAPVYAAEEQAAADNTGRIAGIATDKSNTPLAGIQVSLAQSSEAGKPWEWQLAATTDQAGAYVITNLAPGSYKVRFADPTEKYAFTFYGAVSRAVEAKAVDVQGNQTTTQIDASLAVGGAISGVVKLTTLAMPLVDDCSTERPICANGGGLTLYKEGEPVAYTTPDFYLDGVFKFGGLPAGTYQIEYQFTNSRQSSLRSEFWHGFYPDGYSLTEAGDLHVMAGQSLTEVNIIDGMQKSAGRIRGRVLDASGSPLNSIDVQLYRQLLPGELSTGYMGWRFHYTNQQGEYDFPGLEPGLYTLRFADRWIERQPRYQFQVYKERASLSTATLITVVMGITTVNPDVVLSSITGQIMGRSLYADGSSFSLFYSDLQLYYLDGNQWLLFDDLPSLHSLQYDPDTASYQIDGLATGDYRLTYDAQGSDGKFYTLALHQAPTLHVVAGEITQHDLHFHQATAQIQGRVTSGTGAHLAHIGVVYSKQTGPDSEEFVGWVDTGTDGSYSIPTSGIHPDYQAPLQPGRYRLRFFDRSGIYVSAYHQNVASLLIEAITNTMTTAPDMPLTPAGFIIGQINLFDGIPLGKAVQPAGYTYEINLYRFTSGTWEMWTYGESNMSPTPELTTFDPTNGTYRLGGLPSGIYRVGFTVHHNGTTYTKFYPNANTLEAASDIQVTGGTTTPNINITMARDSSILALYALALDNDPDAINNLAPQLTPAMQSIIDATRDQPNKTAVVLADAAGSSDTRIYVVRNGRATPVRGLPNAHFQLDPTLTELNMADGATLGHFIRWARTTYPAQVTIFGFAGHGEALAPKTDLQKILQPGGSGGGAQPLAYGGLFPLPRRIWTSPTYTDNHPTLALITPYDLAEALRIGSENGAKPLQIADIAHCFAASIEELYELSPGSQPYAEIIIAAPNYAYLDPPALGQALAAINTTLTPARMASTILQTYDRLVAQVDANDGDADVEHPRLLVAVNSRQVARIKVGWDQVAATLLQNLDVSKIRNAYLASPKYDSPLCDAQTWALDTPDALVDLASFAQALQAQYGAASAVEQAIAPVLSDLKTVLIDRVARNGVPWFAPPGTPPWNFDHHQGIALFADLHGRPLADPNRVELRWQTRWYTADPLGGDNPYPFAFVQSSANAATWATVLAGYWRQQGVAIETSVCFPDPLVNSQSSELRSDRLIYPISGTLAVGTPLHLAAAVQSDHALVKPEVRFALYDANQTLLFSETVRGGYWLTGTHPVAATRRYTPTAPGPLTIVVQVDPSQRVTEKNESDNQLTAHFEVASADVMPLTIQAQLPDEKLLVNADRLALPVTMTPAGGAAQLVAQIQQYAVNETTQVWAPHLVAVQELDPARPELRLTGLQPGPVVVHLWARSPAGRYSTTAATLRFNYAPAGVTLGAGQTHYYLAPAGRSAALTFHLARSAGEAQLLAWSPFNAWAADWATQANETGLTLPPLAEPGDYLVAVQADSASQYTLSTVSHVTSASSTPVDPLASTVGITSRPTFLVPIPPTPTAVVQRIYLGQVWR